MSGWRFSLADPTWEDGVDAVPTEERKREFWEIAVRRFATHAGPRPPQPCLVVCRVTAPARWGRPPGGPLGRAKGLLDALHDDRRSGPRYGACAPLQDDHPEHVSGLAVEVRAGEPRTDYLVGRGLRIAGELLASVPVAVEAPNDIVGTLGEKARIAVDRIAYGRAVREAFASYAGLMNRRPAALVVRHRPQRDEDNTWATWIAGACGVRSRHGEHWAAEAPLTGWAPTSIASLADATLDAPVRYEIWG